MEMFTNIGVAANETLMTQRSENFPARRFQMIFLVEHIN
jgi:hypothetical protein